MTQSNVTESKQLIKNSLFNSISWVVTVIINVITTPYIVYKLTVEGYGVYVLLTSLIGYYNLLDLGLGQGIIKFVAEYRVKGNNDGIYRSINAALWVQIITGSLCSLGLILCSEPLLKILKISPYYYNDAKIGLYVSAAGFFFTFLSGSLISTLMGLQRYDITSKVNVSINLLLNIFSIFILYLGNGLKEIIYLNTFFSIFSFFMFIVIVRKQLPEWFFSFTIDILYFKKLLNFSGFLFISRMSDFLKSYITKFIISVSFWEKTPRLQAKTSV